jgi:nuclear pore complex protein Nup160
LSNERSTAGLLDEVDWTLLYNGLPRYYSHVVSLFESEKAYSYVIDFARLALQFASPNSDDEEIIKLRTDIQSRLFNAALQTSSFDIAYSTVTLFSDHAVQHSLLRYLVIQMCESSSSIELLQLPFLGLQDAVDEILASKCHSIVDVTVGVPYHKILYAWRIRRNDFRGAAAVSLERLQRMKMAGMGDKVLGSANGANHDELETPVTKQYLMLINALSCVDPKQAWILAEDTTRNGKENGAVGKRKVFTLDDIRKDYQSELDRIAAIENNQFAFAGGDEMDLV